jgi:uncharacterized protein YjbI with pentapeptide repeats
MSGKLRRKVLLKEKLTEQFAYRNYQRRVAKGVPGNAEEDWKKAERKARRIVRSPIRLFFYGSRQLFDRSFSDWDRDDWLQFSEVVGVIAIPVLILVLQLRYQERFDARNIEFQNKLNQSNLNFQQKIEDQNLERFRQDLIRNYYSQLSSIYLDLDGEGLRDEKNKQLRNLTIASTHAILYDSTLDSQRKGEIIRQLSTMGLVQSQGEEKPLIPLLPGIELNGVDLRQVNLSNADLSDADLRHTNISLTNLGLANLSNANLSNTDLSNANLSNTDLRGANLSNANLHNVNLWNANLVGARVNDNQLEKAFLCKTKLPPNSKLDGDRDC